MKKYWNLIQYMFYVALILTFVAIIIDFILMPFYVRQGQMILLPNTQGMKIEDAVSLLESRGFKPVELEPKYTTTFGPGLVSEQNPSSNSKVKMGRRIYLTPALEERLLKVPNIVGLSQRNAFLRMEQSGFRIDSVFYDYSEKILEGAVIAQSLTSEIEAKRGTPVWITVSLGSQPDHFKVPDLIGKSLATAKEFIVKSGLNEGEVSYRIDAELIPYTVLWQSIRANTRLTKRSAISLIVSIVDVSQIPDVPDLGEEL